MGRVTRLWAAMLAAAALLPGSAGIAVAADPAQLDCPTTSWSEAERASFAAYLADGAFDRGDRRFRAYRSAVDRCAESLDWPQPVAELAFRFNLSALAQAENRRRLEAIGFDVAPIEQAVLADRELLAALASGPYPEREMSAFIDRLDPAVKQRMRDDATGQAVGNLGMFIMFRATMEAARTAFGAN